MVDGLRSGGTFSAVFDDRRRTRRVYDLRCTMRRFEADYTADREGADGADTRPTVFVALDCTLGRHRDRALLASFTAQGSALARADRLNDVVAAFERGDAHRRRPSSSDRPRPRSQQRPHRPGSLRRSIGPVPSMMR